MQEMADVVLKRKRLSKTKTVVIFRRNDLSFADFSEIDGCYVYAKIQVACVWMLIIILQWRLIMRGKLLRHLNFLS